MLSKLKEKTMTKAIYLLTGFLGSGKTTALRELTKYFPDKKIVYIINEYSKNNVDANIINDLKGKIEEINYGLISCVCKLPLFEEMLTDLEETDLDVIFIEASGLADPQQVEDTILYVSEFSGSTYEYKGAICILDAARFLVSSVTNRRVLQQLALADLIILNKADLASEATLAEIEKRISVMKPEIDLIKTTYSKLPFKSAEELDTALDLKDVNSNVPDVVGESRDYDLKRMIFEVNPAATVNQIRHFLQLISDETYRIKGFCRLESEEKIILIDCVGPIVEVKEYKQKLLYEENLNLVYVIFDTHFNTAEVVTDALENIDHNYFTIQEVV